MPLRNPRYLLLLALVTALIGSGTAIAHDFPSRPITMIVPFAAGGPSDVLARILAERMKDTLGQSVIIENVAGAVGALAAARTARSAPDGYTINLGNSVTHVLNGAMQNLSYDLLTDFEPIAFVADNPLLIVGRTSLPASDLQSLIEWIKAQPGPVNAGTSGVGALSHVAGVHFQLTTGTRLQYVPYRGVSPAMQDMIAGQIDLMFDQISNSLPHVRAGKIKAYAVTAKARSAAAPDIPTSGEAGLADFHVSAWHGLWAPKGTPAAVIAKINAAVSASLEDPAVRQKLAALGQEIPAPAQRTPDALRAHHKAEIEKWWPTIKRANIKAE